MTKVGGTHPWARLRPVAFALATAGLAVSAAFVLFSTFMVYDDEGYVLFSLRNFAERGGLYRDVYSQYGPFPYVLYYVIHALGLPLTHLVGRILTVVAWAGAAVACASVAAQATRSAAARFAVLAAVFVFLWIMASEPNHPGGLIVLLTTLLAAVGHRAIAADQPGRWAIAAGALAAALLLTKINVGIFTAFSAGAWLLLYHRNDLVRRWALPVLGGACVLLPLALMRSLLHEAWVRSYALAFACGGLALLVAIAAGASGRTTWRTLGSLVAAASAMGAMVLGLVMVRGTSAADLLDGILLGPLRHPVTFNLPFVWPAAINGIAIASVAACAAAWWLRRRETPWLDRAIAALRLTIAVLFALHLLRYPRINPGYQTLGYVLPLLWLWAWPLRGEEPRTVAARNWVALLLLGQCLHAYPVAGSQIAWSTVLAIPLATIGAWDAARWLARQRGAEATRSFRLVRNAALLTVGLVLGWKFATVAARYREGQYLALPGAEIVRLPDDAAARYQVLALNAVAHGDMLFSLPGMFSFNLWTGLPAPTPANVTHWFSILTEAQQREIIRGLESHPRACVIVDHGHIDLLVRKGFPPRGLLRDYIDRNFVPAFWVDRFAFCVQRGREIHPFGLGDLLTRADGAGGESALLRLPLLVPPARPVATIELEPEAAGQPAAVLNAANARIEIGPLNARGEPAGPPRPANWPWTFAGPGTLFLYFDQEKLPAFQRDATIVLRDATGDTVGLARLRP